MSTREERPADGATFAPRRLGGSRGTAPTTAIAWVAILGSVIVLAIAGRAGSDAGTGVGRASGAPSEGRSIQLGPSPIVDGGPAALPTRRPRISSGPGPIELEVVRTAGSIYVHGDVNAEQVVWVFVSVHADSGRVAGWASVSFPSAVGDDGDPGQALRFDVELGVPEDMRRERLWAQANVYNALGRRVGTTRLEVPSLGAPAPSLSASPESAVLRGFRPGAHFPLLDASFEDEP